MIDMSASKEDSCRFRRSTVLKKDVVVSRFDDKDKKHVMKKLEPLIEKSISEIIDDAEKIASKQLCLPGIE